MLQPEGPSPSSESFQFCHVHIWACNVPCRTAHSALTAAAELAHYHVMAAIVLGFLHHQLFSLHAAGRGIPCMADYFCHLFCACRDAAPSFEGQTRVSLLRECPKCLGTCSCTKCLAKVTKDLNENLRAAPLPVVSDCQAMCMPGNSTKACLTISCRSRCWHHALFALPELARCGQTVQHHLVLHGLTATCRSQRSWHPSIQSTSRCCWPSLRSHVSCSTCGKSGSWRMTRWVIKSPV